MIAGQMKSMLEGYGQRITRRNIDQNLVDATAIHPQFYRLFLDHLLGKIVECGSDRDRSGRCGK